MKHGCAASVFVTDIAFARPAAQTVDEDRRHVKRTRKESRFVRGADGTNVGSAAGKHAVGWIVAFPGAADCDGRHTTNGEEGGSIQFIHVFSL